MVHVFTSILGEKKTQTQSCSLCCNIAWNFHQLVKKGLVVSISDTKLNFYVTDFQQRTGDTQLISAGRVTHRGTNRKHSSSKELSFIAAQPVTRFNHSLGIPRRENLKWPLSFLPSALKALQTARLLLFAVSDRENWSFAKVLSH